MLGVVSISLKSMSPHCVWPQLSPAPTPHAPHSSQDFHPRVCRILIQMCSRAHPHSHTGSQRYVRSGNSRTVPRNLAVRGKASL